MYEFMILLSMNYLVLLVRFWMDGLNIIHIYQQLFDLYKDLQSYDLQYTIKFVIQD